MGPGQLTFLCLLGLVSVAKEATSQALCSVPQWPSVMQDENPFVQYEGKVLLVALMKGYCGYCWHQSHNLQRLRNHLWSRGFPDIEIVIINGGEPASRNNIGNFDSYTNLTIIQDTESNTLYNLFGGNKDDFIVYNRCGQRTWFITHPRSYLGRTYTELVLRAVHRGRTNRCSCNLDPPRTSRGRRSADNDMKMEVIENNN